MSNIEKQIKEQRLLLDSDHPKEGHEDEAPCYEPEEPSHVHSDLIVARHDHPSQLFYQLILLSQSAPGFPTSHDFIVGSRIVFRSFLVAHTLLLCW